MEASNSEVQNQAEAETNVPGNETNVSETVPAEKSDVNAADVSADQDTDVAADQDADVAADQDADVEEGDSGDEFGEIDLNAIEVATEVLDQLNNSFKPTEYDNIMNACSSTAQALKQTISDVLRARENLVSAAGDTSIELENTLTEKLADFKNVVSGSYMTSDPKTDLTNIKHPAFSNVIITEVNENEETNLDSPNSSTQVVEEDKPSPDSSISDASESNLNASSPKPENTEKNENDLTSSSSNKGNSKEIKNTKVSSQPEVILVSNSPEEEKNLKKQQKYNPNKKKGEKTVDQIMKSLANCSSTEEKLQTLCKKYAEALDDLRLFEPRMKQLERQVASQQREKEQLQAEHNRMILAKSRLESLCRELQRQNKAVKEESLSRIKEEEERRKEIASKFQVTLNDISMLMQENAKKNMKLREENSELAKKLKALVDHYDMWEKHMEKVVQQSNLEAQLAKAKHAKINLLLKQETEKFLREKQTLLENMSELQKKCTLLTSNELKLRTELGDYTSKYEEFQTVLNKSSQVFASFKNDMEATSKKIKKLEKETNVYKQKWESSNNALLGMINDKQKHDKELANAQQRILTLEKLCRALQAERNELQNQLNVVSGAAKSPTSTEAQA